MIAAACVFCAMGMNASEMVRKNSILLNKERAALCGVSEDGDWSVKNMTSGILAHSSLMRRGSIQQSASVVANKRNIYSYKAALSKIDLDLKNAQGNDELYSLILKKRASVMALIDEAERNLANLQ